MRQPNNTVPKIMIILFLILSIYEIVITFLYIFMINKKNNFENEVCIFTIIKAFLNLIFCVYIYNSYIINNEFKYDILKLFVFIFNSWSVVLYIKINNCGIFKTAVVIEFIIYSICCTLLILFSLLLIIIFFGYKLSSHNYKSPPVIISIPQIACPINNDQLMNINVPEAYQVNISIGTSI